MNKYFLLFGFAILPFLSYSQSDGIKCQQTINAIIQDQLLKLDTNNIDLSSNNVKLVIELFLLDCGEVDSVSIIKSNLSDFSIKEIDLIVSLIGIKVLCLIDVYYEIEEIQPSKIVFIYNTNLYNDKMLIDE